MTATTECVDTADPVRFRPDLADETPEQMPGRSAFLLSGSELVMIRQHADDRYEVVYASGAKGEVPATPDAVLILPDAGTGVTLRQGHREHTGWWVATNVSAGTITVLAHDGLRTWKPTITDLSRITTKVATAESYASARALHHLIVQADDTAKRHSDQIDTLVADAHRYATDNDLCETFDRFMLDHDLPGRERTYEVTLGLQVDITISHIATTEEIHADEISLDTITAALREEDPSNISVTVIDVTQ